MQLRVGSCSLRVSEVNRIPGKVDELADSEELMSVLVVGENVKVIDGPFNGFSGLQKKLMKRSASC